MTSRGIYLRLNKHYLKMKLIIATFFCVFALALSAPAEKLVEAPAADPAPVAPAPVKVEEGNQTIYYAI